MLRAIDEKERNTSRPAFSYAFCLLLRAMDSRGQVVAQLMTQPFKVVSSRMRNTLKTGKLLLSDPVGALRSP